MKFSGVYLVSIFLLLVLFSGCVQEDLSADEKTSGEEKTQTTCWEKTFGKGNYDVANSIQQTKDGGYIIGGRTDLTTFIPSYQNTEYVWILKLDSAGNLEWDKTFGGSNYDQANSIQQTKDGGYIVAGYTGSKAEKSKDVWILKLDANGNLEWDKTFRRDSSSNGMGYSIQQTLDEGYIISAESSSLDSIWYNMWVMKLDPNGNLEWDKTFGSLSNIESSSIQQTSDEGYIASTTFYTSAGWVCLFPPPSEFSCEGAPQIYVDADGKLFVSLSVTNEVGKTLKGKTSPDSNITPIEVLCIIESSVTKDLFTKAGSNVKTFDENYAPGALIELKEIPCVDKDGNQIETAEGVSFKGTIAIMYSQDGDTDYSVKHLILGTVGVEVPITSWILKLDSEGNLEWNQTFSTDYAESIQQTTDEGYFIVGYTESKDAGGYDNIWTLKLSQEGNYKWEKVFGGSKSDRAYSGQQTVDEGYIVAGYTKSKGTQGKAVWILKLDSNGNLEWDKTFGGSVLDSADSIQQVIDGGYIVAAKTYSKGAGDSDIWILKIDSNGNYENCE